MEVAISENGFKEVVLYDRRAVADGIDGVLSFVRAHAPFHAFTASHEDLTDEELKGIIDAVELETRQSPRAANLAGNRITDTGLTYLLDRWVHRDDAGLTGLWLPANDIKLRLPCPSSLSRLQVLSLSSNPLDNASFVAFLSSLDAPNLRQLYVDCCGLTATGSSALADWLSDSRRCSLTALHANGNVWDTAGCLRLLQALAPPPHGGANVTLRQLGFLQSGGSSAPTEPPGDLDAALLSPLLRNECLQRDAKLAAIGILTLARVVLVGRPEPPASEFRRRWDDLPPELQVRIWKHVGEVSAPIRPSETCLDAWHPRPLTDLDVVRILAVAQDRSTLGQCRRQVLPMCVWDARIDTEVVRQA